MRGTLGDHQPIEGMQTESLCKSMISVHCIEWMDVVLDEFLNHTLEMATYNGYHKSVFL
jgi:hypothetical protein